MAKRKSLKDNLPGKAVGKTNRSITPKTRTPAVKKIRTNPETLNISPSTRSEELDIYRVNRVYEVITKINELVVRNPVREKLFSESCRIAIEYGGFQTAWIGMIEEENRVLKPVGSYDISGNIPGGIKDTPIGDTPGTRGPTLTAILNGEVFYSNDIQHDPAMTAWRTDALRRSYRSSISLPLIVANKPVGVFSIHSSEPDAFHEKEIRLLSSVTGNISFALERMQFEEQKIISEEKLRQSRERLGQIVNSSGIWVWEVDVNGMYTYASPMIEGVLGYLPEEVVGKKYFYDFFTNETRDGFKEAALRVFAAKGNIIDLENPNVHKNGQVIFLETSCFPILGDNGELLGYRGSDKDITRRKAVENALDNEIAYRRSLFEQSPDGIIIIEPETARFEEFNTAAHEQLGYTRSEFALLSIHHIEAKETVEQTKKTIQKVIETGRVDFETLQRTKQGELRNVFVTAQIIEVHGRRKYHCIWRDITERRKAERRTEESEKNFKDIFENAPVGYHELDSEGRIVRNNVTALAILGYSKEEMYNQPVWNFSVSPDISEKRTRAKLRGEIMPDRNIERMFRTKDNKTVTLFVVEKYLYDERNNIIGMRTAYQDITEMKEVEHRVKMLAHSLESVSECVCILDNDDKIAFVNEAFVKTYGYTERELLNQPISIISPVENIDSHPAGVFAEAKRGGWRGEVVTRKKDGSLFPSLISTSVIRNRDGVQEALITVSIDISEMKRNREELIQAKDRAEEMSRLKSSFLANMSHELRTPMIGILGYSEILENTSADPSVKEAAHIINKSGRRLMDTLNLVLDLSRMEAAKLDINMQDVEVVSAVNDASALFQEQAEKKSLSLVVDAEVKSLWISADARMFRQVITGIISNAVKYTRHGGIYITVGSEKHGETEWAVIKVKDTGIGIGPESIELIWDEFRQVSEGLSRGYEGLGLGLTITKNFVEKMKGNITVESEIGKGSTFVLKFPAIENKTPFVQPPDIEIRRPRASFRNTVSSDLPSVLYVEDDTVAYNLAKYLLRNICILEWAQNSRQALEYIRMKQYEAVMMDINLGNESHDGVATTKMLREVPGYSDLPIIAVTAYALSGDKERFLKAGCTHYISKPFTSAEIINLLTRVLGE